MDIMHALNKLLDYQDPDLIISGGATGVDTQAELYANSVEIPLLVLKPDYKNHGRSAPLVRNLQIVDRADAVIAFWNGTSRGTMFVINYAKKQGKRVMVIE
jgi:hypothetical protein